MKMKWFNRIWNIAATSMFFIVGVYAAFMAIKYNNDGMGWVAFALFMLLCVMGNLRRTIDEWGPKTKKHKDSIEDTAYMLDACGKCELARAVEEALGQNQSELAYNDVKKRSNKTS